MADDNVTKIDDAIVEAAQNPLKYEIDGEKAESHSLSDMIAAAKYMERRRAAANPLRCLRFAKISRPDGGA